MINKTPTLLFLVSFFFLSSTAQSLTEREELDKVLIHVKESYYGTVDTEALVGSTLQEVLDSLDNDSRVVEGEMPSLDFVRGLEEEASIAEVRLITPEIGYIKIGFFGRRTGAHFKKALETLGAVALPNSTSLPLDVGGKGGGESPSPFPLPPGEGVVDGSPPQADATSEPRIKGLLLDLRDNPGGHLQSALEVLNKFVPPGKVLLIEKTKGGEKPYLSEGIPVGARCNVPLLPIVILINNFTASSAEIVASTLRYHCGARVIGEKSKGKGTIQEVIPLGARTLILTIGEYLQPDGSSLRDKGVIPDLEVKGYEEQFHAARSLLSVGSRQ